MENPLVSDDPEVWTSLVTAVHPDSILVAIKFRMGSDLRERLTPEDIFQETLLKAWRGRTDFEWQGTPAFRRWLLRIAERCICDERDAATAQKRDLARTAPLASPRGGAGESSRSRRDLDPWTSTTPSRMAIARERAQAMEKSLEGLPDDLREVVRLRLFEDLPIEEIAGRLGLGESAVRHRFRKGAELYRERLREALGPSSFGGRAPGAPDV